MLRCLKYSFRLIKISFFLLAFLFSGCQQGPVSGGGGYAELNNSPFIPTKISSSIRPVDLLSLRLSLARTYLMYLNTQGAKSCFPGQYAKSQEQANLVTRKILAEYYSDAINSLIILESQINSLSARLAVVADKVSCQSYNKVLSSSASSEKFIKKNNENIKKFTPLSIGNESERNSVKK